MSYVLVGVPHSQLATLKVVGPFECPIQARDSMYDTVGLRVEFRGYEWTVVKMGFLSL